MMIKEGVIEEFSHRDQGTSRIVSAFVVGDGDDEPKAQREEHLRPCMDAASGVGAPEDPRLGVKPDRGYRRTPALRAAPG